MSRRIDVNGLKNRARQGITIMLARYDSAPGQPSNYALRRWIAKMTAVELHSIWERYVEARLVGALNHYPMHFLEHNSIKGVSRVSSGFAKYIVRSGGRYFDFRSMSDLLEKGDRWLGDALNPFRKLSQSSRAYVDLLNAVRNCVVHGSDSAIAAYKRQLKAVYGITSTPEPDEFLNAKDLRKSSPLRYKPRLCGLACVIQDAIQTT